MVDTFLVNLYVFHHSRDKIVTWFLSHRFVTRISKIMWCFDHMICESCDKWFNWQRGGRAQNNRRRACENFIMQSPPTHTTKRWFTTKKQCMTGDVPDGALSFPTCHVLRVSAWSLGQHAVNDSEGFVTMRLDTFGFVVIQFATEKSVQNDSVGCFTFGFRSIRFSGESGNLPDPPGTSYIPVTYQMS